MNRALVLACGNPHRGDDAAGLEVANGLRSGLCDPATEVFSYQQWMPELAEPISKAELVIFVDASEDLSPGTVACRKLQPAPHSAQSITHQTSPKSLLWLAKELYGKHPAHAYLVTVGGASFDLSEKLSDSVRHAIPHAVERIKALLSGVTVPEE
jgi:hydrogenase maturation protease